MNEELLNRVLDGIDTLKMQHGEILARLAKMDGVCEKAEITHEVVHGNGAPEKGLAHRVALLEHEERRREWAVKTAVGAAITAAGAALWKLITSN